MSLLLFPRKLVVCWCLAVACPVLVFGQIVNPQGPEYSIAGAMIGDQAFPSAAISPGGGFLAWQDNAVSPLGLRIRAVALGGNLLGAGSPFAISSAVGSKTAGDQERPQVALLNDGGAVFVWQGGKLGFQQIYVRFLGADGLFLTSDVRVSKASKNSQVNPAVAALPDGSVIVVWSSYGQDGSRQGVFAQHFSATGAKLGSEFQVNQFTPNNQRTPAVAALASGNFVIVWISELQRDSASVDVYARIFDPSAAPVTDEFPVNSATTNMCANPTVAGSAQGGFAVAWSQNDILALTAGSTDGVVISGVPTTQSELSWDVYGRVFDANGVATAGPFRLNTHTYGDQYAPRVSVLNTNYLAVWTSLGQDGSFEGVFGQAFASDGSLEGGELPVNTHTISRQIQPLVVSDGASRFLAVWSSIVIGTGFDLFARQYE